MAKTKKKQQLSFAQEDAFDRDVLLAHLNALLARMKDRWSLSGEGRKVKYSLAEAQAAE